MPQKINVLLIGSGGREHALAKKIRQSPLTGNLFCAPGNGGISRTAKCVKLDIKGMTDVVSFSKKEKIGLVVIGPEVPLVAGLSDKLREAGIPVFGPSKEAAQLEGSKAFLKTLFAKYGIPTAPFKIFENPDEARAYLREAGREFPLVIKTSGLAAGKGAIICANVITAVNTVTEMMDDGKFGDAGKTIIIEKYLPGEEASFMVVSDGENVVPLATSQDHKRAFDSDSGPNTGGMGAYSPAPVVTPALQQKIMDDIIKPTIAAMKSEGCPFQGLLYAGLMIAGEDVWVLEHNIRFGDPETQPVLMRMKSDIMPLLLGSANGNIADIKIEWDPRPAVCVVMASEKYPEKSPTGFKISGLQKAGRLSGVQILHAATVAKPTLGYITAGGRVLNVNALGEFLSSALARAYQAVSLVTWQGARYRTDIGKKAIDRE